MSIRKVLKEVLLKIRLDEKEAGSMQQRTQKFVEVLKKNIKKKKIKAEVFVGGSSGKGTVVKRKKQDIDIFVRFEKDKNIPLLEKILVGKKKKIHGSRDYFKVSYGGLGFEVVPVLKIKNPKEARNVTDLSYFHVSYVKRKIKQLGIKDDIMLAKTFCYAQGVYGAESYIKGFSGYSLELLIIHYKSFEKMIRALSKVKDQIIIDTEKHYKGKKVMREMNESKLASPIILVDPTFKERNALAGLGLETFLKFQLVCRKFLKKPNEKFFVKKEIDKKKFNLILQARTNRQEGDIAGSKLYKFFLLIERQLRKYFDINRKEFDYADKKFANLYFKIKAKKQIIIEGPPVTAVENVTKFKKKHKNAFVKKGKVYARKKSISVRKFLSDFKKNNKKRMRDMGITGFKLNQTL